MNRIYQGRVSRIQILRPLAECGSKRDSHHGTKPEHWAELASDREHARTASENLMWEHHALFQDAVNYYLVCLLALAHGDTEKTKKIVELRDRLTCEPDRSQSDYDETQHFYIWGRFQRRGANRPGLRDSVAKYLTPGNPAPTFAECAAAALAGNEVSLSLLDLAFAELLSICSGDNPIKNQGRWMLDRFCNPAYTGGFPYDTAAAVRKSGEFRLTTEFHQLRDQSEYERFAREIELSWVVNLSKGAEPFKGEAARSRLLKAVFHFRQAFGEKAETEMGERVAVFLKSSNVAERSLAEIHQHIREMPVDALPVLPANNRSIADRLEGCILYKVFPSQFTVDLLRVSYPPAKSNTKTKKGTSGATSVSFTRFGGDAIELARGNRGYVFRAFTRLPIWHQVSSSKLQWIGFDTAAFKEALKALHQIESKGEERRKECVKKQALHAYQRGRAKNLPAGTDGEETARPPILAGDPRIARLAALVDDELKAEYEMSEGVLVKYGLHQRTIRGFHDIRKLWNAALEKKADAAQIVAILTDYKRDNVETIGSPVLFDAIAKPENWIIWREPSADQMHEWRESSGLGADAHFADDPLQALTDERELLTEIADLELPVRLTPADPEHSRRQYFFYDGSNRPTKGRLRHNQPWIDVEIARKRDGKFAPEWVRLHFTAPRLLRDQLTAHDATALPWQQPMMAALGLSQPLTKGGKPATFEECAAVALMPEGSAAGPKRILLNFPVEIDALHLPKELLRLNGREQEFRTRKDPLTKKLSFDSFWDAQMLTSYKQKQIDKLHYLRWPVPPLVTEKNRTERGWWWERDRNFSCLSIDLGQRDAGAYAVLEASPDAKPKPQSRQLGVAAGRTWWATVRAMGSLRLPGEDAKVIRDGKPQEELYGERGRSLVIDGERDEWAEAQAICRGLGFDPDKLLGTEPRRYSFPELNGELLYALRRAQARLARLQSWSCVAHEPPEESKRPAFAKRRDAIVAELRVTLASLDTPAVGQELPQRSAWLREIVAPLERGELSVIAARVVREILDERARIQSELVRIADRIQPLRGRRWTWVKRADGENHWLQPSAPGTDGRRKLLAGQRGLSIERIEQLESLRQRCQSLNRALRQPPGEPAGLGRGKRGIELPDPCPDLLDRLEALKEQRVNQTAHLILAQALGVRLKAHATDPATRRARDIHGEYERIPGRAPVDFVVLENLDRYLANQGRSKAENSRLMKWCHRAILGKLKQLCEPYGLRVVETPAAYSSQFCSLTGGPGFRAIELTPDSFREHRWKKHLDRPGEAVDSKRSPDHGDRLESEAVRALRDASLRLNHDLLDARDAARAAGNPFRPKWRTLLAPVAGGPIFVPLHGHPMQADLNAAINIGLRAIAAPDTGDIHVRIRAERKDDGFVVRAENVREKARWGDKPPAIDVPKDADRKKLLTESHLNFFADARRSAGYDHAVIAGDSGYASGRGLFGTIKGGDHHLGQNWLRCGTLNNDRLEKEKLERPLPQQEDVKWE